MAVGGLGMTGDRLDRQIVEDRLKYWLDSLEKCGYSFTGLELELREQDMDDDYGLPSVHYTPRVKGASIKIELTSVTN